MSSEPPLSYEELVRRAKQELGVIKITNNPQGGRYATVMLPSGGFRWGYAVHDDYQPKSEDEVVWQGREVKVTSHRNRDIVRDEDGNPVFLPRFTP